MTAEASDTVVDTPPMDRGEFRRGLFPGGQPLFDRAIVSFECEVVAGHLYDTHTIFIGKVRSLRRAAADDALIYLDGGFARIERLAAK